MERTAVLHADYLDILFDHRNKTYGGYELRKHYSERAFKATIITLSVVALLIVAHAIAGRFKTQVEIAPPVVIANNITDLKMEQPKPKIQLPAAAPPPAAPTKIFTPPVVMHDPDVPTPPATIDDLKNKNPGVTDIKGDPNALNPGIVETKDIGTALVVVPKKAEIFTYVEQMPQFEGDLNSYLVAHIRYPELAKDNSIEGRVSIKFVVNEDGTIAAAEVLRGIGGGCDEEALRVLNTMPKWKPGKQNGRPVKVYFTLPILFKLG